MNTKNTTETKKTRGRKPLNLGIPNKPFTITKLHAHLLKHNKSISRIQVSNRIKKMVLQGTLQVVEEKQAPRGRPFRIFMLTPEDQVKASARRAKNQEKRRIQATEQSLMEEEAAVS